MSPERLQPSCPKCGAPIQVPDGPAYAHCTYCGSSAFVDLEGAFRHQIIRPSVRRPRVPGLIRARAQEAGWPATTVSGLQLAYEPVWELEGAGGRRVHLRAHPGPDGRMGLVEVPGGERDLAEAADRDPEARWIEPELAPEAAAEVVERATGAHLSARVTRLLHRPVYIGRITLNGDAREVRVDAVTGDLLDESWPARATFTHRNQARFALAAMLVAATALPLVFAAPIVVATGAIVVWAGRASARTDS